MLLLPGEPARLPGQRQPAAALPRARRAVQRGALRAPRPLPVLLQRGGGAGSHTPTPTPIPTPTRTPTPTQLPWIIVFNAACILALILLFPLDMLIELVALIMTVTLTHPSSRAPRSSPLTHTHPHGPSRPSAHTLAPPARRRR